MLNNHSSVCVAQNKSVPIHQCVSIRGLDQNELGELLPPHLLLGSHKAMVAMSTPHRHFQAVAGDVHIAWAGEKTLCQSDLRNDNENLDNSARSPLL